MLFLVAFALAGTSAASFATDAGDWDGGTVTGGALVLVDDAATLDVGAVTSFEFTARMRLASGDAFRAELNAGCVLRADYTDGKNVSFNTESVPFGVDELELIPDASFVLAPGTSTSEGAGVSDPDVVYFSSRWWMFYTASSSVGGTEVHAATSFDLQTWTRLSSVTLAGGSQPAAVVDGTELVVYYAQSGSIYRTTSSDGAAFSFPSVALAPGPGFDAPGLGHPSVLLDDGAWRLFYGVPTTGATGSATSSDGLSFTRDAELSADDSRLGALDVADDIFGLEGVYTMLDAVGFARAGDDAAFTDDSADLLPLLGINDAAWSDGGFGTSALVRSENELTLFVDAVDSGARGIARVATAPSPGTWGTLSVIWDGATATASWNDGPALTCPMVDFEALILGAEGQLEIDEAEITYVAVEGDDTATLDTADTGDSAAVSDSGDTAVPDTADTGVGFNAGEWMGEPGGCGCDSAGGPGVAASVSAALLLLRAARRK